MDFSYCTEILLAVLLCCITVTLVLYMKSSSSHANTPPSLPWLPLVGSLPFLSDISKFHLFLTESVKRYGNVYAFYAGRRYTVILNGHEAITEALVKRSADFAGRAKMHAEEVAWNPEQRGIIFRQYSDDFKIIRKKSLSILRKLGFGERAILETRIHEEIKECILSIRAKNNAAFDAEPIFRTFTLSIIFRILFGTRPESGDPEYLRNVINTYEKSLDPLLDLFWLARYLPKLKKLMKELIPLTNKFKEFVKITLSKCLNNGSEQEVFVKEFLKETVGKFDETEVHVLIKDFISAGMFTSSTQLLWCTLLIANNPIIQERLQRELDLVVPRDRLPSVTDKLPYHEATILEVMRLKTTIPLSLPHTTIRDTKVAGFFIPKDTQIIVNLWSAHMDPEIWDDPEKFRPERFLNDEEQIINRDRMIGFSLGKRSCPGEVLARQEILLNIASLLQQFDLLPPEGQSKIPDRGLVNLFYTPDPFDIRCSPRSF